MAPASPPGVHAPTVVAAGVLATALGVAAHEGAHALAGWMSGGEVVSLSSTGVEGHWSTLRNAGWFFLSTSGSVAQWTLAFLGWLVFRRAVGSAPVVALAAWVLFAVNAWMPAMYLIASPAFGFGDWMDLLTRFAALGPLRVSATVTGLFVVGLLWEATAETLARLAGGGSAASRTARAHRVTRFAWVGCGLVAAAAGVLAPIGPLRGAAIALGSTLGSTWPLLLAAGGVGERPVPGPPTVVRRGPVLIGTAMLVGLLFVALLGPGIRLA